MVACNTLNWGRKERNCGVFWIW